MSNVVPISQSQQQPQPTNKLIVFDRSRITVTEHCMRERYLGYHWGGVGLDRISLRLDLEVGKCTHAILADVLFILNNHSFSETLLNQSINQHLNTFEADIRQRGIELELAAGYEQAEDGTVVLQPPPIEFTLGLYKCWIRNAVTAWTAVRGPQFIQTYEVISIEQEEELLLADGQLLFLSRPDAVLKRHSDGELFILNFKTVGEPNQWWQEQWPLDMQTLTECLPIEARLGQRVSGVLIEGLVKGGKRCQHPRDSGQWWINSPFCWAWTKPAAPPFPGEYAAKYEWTDEDGNSRRLGKGYRRTPVFEDMGAREWLQWLMEHEPELVRQQFVQLPAILRNDAACEQWVRQNVAREHRMFLEAQFINGIESNYQQVALDASFPMSTSGGNCIRPSRCQFFDVCHGTAGVDSLSSGYQLRQPNHPREGEVLSGNR